MIDLAYLLLYLKLSAPKGYYLNALARSQRNATIIQRYVQGKNYREIAKEFNLNKSTLVPILNSDQAKAIQKAAYDRRIALLPCAIEKEMQLLNSDNEQTVMKVVHKLLDDTGIGTSRTHNSIHITLNQDNRMLLNPEVARLFDQQATEQDVEEAQFEVID